MDKPAKLINLIKIPKVLDNCFLFFAQSSHQIPFPVRRIYFIKNANTKLSRGFHAHKKTKQLLFCIQGSVKIVVDNGKARRSILLKSPETGIFLDQMIWHEQYDFKKGTILLVLASTIFDSKDYIRDYKLFLRLASR